MSYAFSERMLSMQPSAIREILKVANDPSIISLAAGNPAPEAFPTEAIAKITAQILAENPIGALQYSFTEGYPALRTALKTFLKERYNVGRSFDELIVLSGAQQAMDFVCKVLCNEGDTIITEAPTFVGALNTFRSYKLNLVGVEMEDDGISLEGLERTLQQEKNVRFIYLSPTFQKPTGKTMSLAKRRAVYDLAKKYGVLIFEDNPYGELRVKGEKLPEIKSFDEDGIVMFVGTFSKILAPGLRVGYICAPAEIIAKMVIAKQCSDVHSNIMAQIICHRFMTEYDFAAHLEYLRSVYRKKYALMLNGLDKQVQGKFSYTRPEGGLFFWGELPEHADMSGFVQALLSAGVAVVPGNAFMIDSHLPTKTFRMNFSTPSDEKLVRGVEILAEVASKML